MKRQKISGIIIVQSILGLLMICAFLFLGIGEIALPAENISEESTCHVLQADWERVMPDGTKETITVPGTCSAGKGEWVTIATKLSGNQEETWCCMRSMQQELRIFVGDELRKEYSTLDTQPFGKTSTMTYVFFPIYSSDAGKVLRIEFMTLSSYSGYVSEMYMGNKFDIEKYFFGLYVPSAFCAVFMFFISLFVVGISVFIRLAFKRSVELFHLGNAILIASTWLIVESKLRQFIFPNSTVAMIMGFLMIAVLPYPILSYVNSIQQRRYEKAYLALGIGSAINFVMVVILQVWNIKDFYETMTLSHVLIITLIVLMSVTIIRDILKGNAREYREVIVGIAGLMIAGVFEIAWTYINSARLNGIALCISLVLLLAAAGLKTIRDMFNMEKENRIAIAASEAKAKFLANMSHEIRTPINAVIGMNEMILRENQDENIEYYANNIKNASQMLLSLINDVLDFSKMEAGKMKIVQVEYNVKSMLDTVIPGAEMRAKQKGLELCMEIDETLPTVLKGDEIRIKQILNNLLSNAIKYTDKGSVTLSAKGCYSQNDFYLILSVIDTGIGIKKEDMEKVFADFQRLELEKNRYIEGTGLGLNITKQLVDIMKGTINVESEYGEGSCFSVKLPQQVVENKRTDALYAPEAKILVVDDMQINLKIVTALLKRSCAQLDFALGGMECLQKTKEKKYDLILMDHMMPEPDGVQTLHLIRDDKDNLNSDTAVIVLTANALEEMKEQYIAEGFADYLSKPVMADDLEKVIAKYLGE